MLGSRSPGRERASGLEAFEKLAEKYCENRYVERLASRPRTYDRAKGAASAFGEG